LIQSTYHAFGNNGTTAYEDSVDSGSDTALNTDLGRLPRVSSTQLYADLIGASDHLPVVADYTIPVVQPTAAFASGPANSGASPLAVTFTDASTGIVTNWLWNFGDGATSNTFTTTSVSHTYTNAGAYSVTETVSGPGGINSLTVTNLIVVIGGYQAWQLEYFGCTNCPQSQTNADADGTGQDNQFKYVAGLNPTNPASVFNFNVAITNVPPAQVQLTFNPNVSGRTYTLLATPSLSSPAWSNIVTSPNTRSTNGSTVTITDGAPVGQKYYELQISGPSL
jgi:PKD repeat protein